MNFTSKQIWLINYPVMMSVLVEQLINITDAIFLGHVGETELGASAIAGMYYLSLYILGFGFSLGLQVMPVETVNNVPRKREKYSSKDYFF